VMKPMLLAIVATLVCAATVSAAGTQPTKRSLVTGHVYAPGDKLPQNSQQRKPLPAVGALVEVLADRHLVAHMRVLASGSFAFRLRPGRYRLVASLTPPKVRSTKQCGSEYLTVRMNRTARVTLECSLF
jgi:hypothetical protein